MNLVFQANARKHNVLRIRHFFTLHLTRYLDTYTGTFNSPCWQKRWQGFHMIFYVVFLEWSRCRCCWGRNSSLCLERRDRRGVLVVHWEGCVLRWLGPYSGKCYSQLLFDWGVDLIHHFWPLLTFFWFRCLMFAHLFSVCAYHAIEKSIWK